MNCHMNCHDSCHDLRRDAWDSWPPTTALHLAAWCPSCLDQKNFGNIVIIIIIIIVIIIIIIWLVV